MSLLRVTSNPFREMADQWSGVDPTASYHEAVEGVAESFLAEVRDRADQTGSSNWTEIIDSAEVWREPSAVIAGFRAGTDQDDRAFDLEYGTLSTPPVPVFRTAKNAFDFRQEFEDRIHAALFGSS